jgi:hypothetical protein
LSFGFLTILLLSACKWHPESELNSNADLKGVEITGGTAVTGVFLINNPLYNLR